MLQINTPYFRLCLTMRLQSTIILFSQNHNTQVRSTYLRCVFNSRLPQSPSFGGCSGMIDRWRVSRSNDGQGSQACRCSVLIENPSCGNEHKSPCTTHECCFLTVPAKQVCLIRGELIWGYGPPQNIPVSSLLALFLIIFSLDVPKSVCGNEVILAPEVQCQMEDTVTGILPFSSTNKDISPFLQRLPVNQTFLREED